MPAPNLNRLRANRFEMYLALNTKLAEEGLE
jgi:hypothetical protein